MPQRPENPEQDAQWRTAGVRIQNLLDASASGGAVAHERAEQLGREVADLYGAGLERAERHHGVVEASVERGSPAAGAQVHFACFRARSAACFTFWAAFG